MIFGNGVILVGIVKMWIQGTLIGMGVGIYLGIVGEGLFVVYGSVDGVSGIFYSRVGSFDWD